MRFRVCGLGCSTLLVQEPLNWHRLFCEVSRNSNRLYSGYMYKYIYVYTHIYIYMRYAGRVQSVYIYTYLYIYMHEHISDRLTPPTHTRSPDPQLHLSMVFFGKLLKTKALKLP